MNTLLIILFLISVLAILLVIFKSDVVLQFSDRGKRKRNKTLLVLGAIAIASFILLNNNLSNTNTFSSLSSFLKPGHIDYDKNQDSLNEEDNIETRNKEITYKKQDVVRSSNEEINIKDFGAVGDYNPETGEGTDDTDAILDAIDSCTPGEVVFFPPGKYKITKPISLVDVKHNKSKFYGTKASELHFIGCNGFQALKHIEEFEISSLRLMGDDTLNTVGILLQEYPTVHTIENLWIDRFGLWGIQQYGGHMFYMRNLNMFGNGKNHNKDYGGSINITTLDDTMDGEVSTVGILEMIYCRVGGEYGLYMKRGADHRIQTFISEYHDHAMYIERAGQIAVNNLYTEANRSKDGDVIEVVDSGVIFNNPLIEEEIKYTWLDASYLGRELTKVDASDISTRFLTANQLRLKTSDTINEEEEEGALQYVDNQLQIFEGSEWVNYQKVLSGTSANRPTENLILGMSYYDTSLGKPIYLHNISPAIWHDAEGNRVN